MCTTIMVVSTLALVLRQRFISRGTSEQTQQQTEEKQKKPWNQMKK
uniref:Uncharacterized protein n=1 Tax=Hippocampus comes TaxID=109280 RepID=A0A3Q2Z5Q2_HIPCM